MNKGKATCEVLKGIRLQIARENCIEYQTEECQFEGNCSGTCPKCEADIRYLEKELVKQNKLGKAVVIAGLSVGLLGGMTGCDSKTQHTVFEKSNSSESVSIKDSILSNPLLENKKKSFRTKCPSVKHIDNMIVLDGDVIKVTPFSDEKLEMFDESYYSDLNEEIVGDIERPVGLMETMPKFPGGMDSLQIYLKKELKYHNTNADITGVVLIGFVVEKDGTVTNVMAIISAHPDLDAEAIRVVENMPKWKPGKQQGKPFRVSMQIPIRFSLK